MDAFLHGPLVLADHQRGAASRGRRLRFSAGRTLVCRQVRLGGKIYRRVHCGKIELLGYAFEAVCVRGSSCGIIDDWLLHMTLIVLSARNCETWRFGVNEPQANKDVREPRMLCHCENREIWGPKLSPIKPKKCF